MGNSNKKIQDYEVVKSFRNQEWIREQKIDQKSQIWLNTRTKTRAEAYAIPTQINNAQLENYELRRMNSEDIVTVYHVELQSNPNLCSKADDAYVLIERVPNRLANIQQLSFQEALTILKAAYKGFNTIATFYGPIQPYEDMICFNEQGVPKMWLNSNLAANKPQKMRQEDPMKGSSDRNEVYVRKIFDMIENRTSTRRLPEELKNKFRQNNPHNYFQALNTLEEYARENNIQIIAVIKRIQLVQEAAVVKSGLYDTFQHSYQKPNTSSQVYPFEQINGTTHQWNRGGASPTYKNYESQIGFYKQSSQTTPVGHAYMSRQNTNLNSQLQRQRSNQNIHFNQSMEGQKINEVPSRTIEKKSQLKQLNSPTSAYHMDYKLQGIQSPRKSNFTYNSNIYPPSQQHLNTNPSQFTRGRATQPYVPMINHSEQMPRTLHTNYGIQIPIKQPQIIIGQTHNHMGQNVTQNGNTQYTRFISPSKITQNQPIRQFIPPSAFGGVTPTAVGAIGALGVANMAYREPKADGNLLASRDYHINQYRDQLKAEESKLEQLQNLQKIQPSESSSSSPLASEEREELQDEGINAQRFRVLNDESSGEAREEHLAEEEAAQNQYQQNNEQQEENNSYKNKTFQDNQFQNVLVDDQEHQQDYKARAYFQEREVESVSDSQQIELPQQTHKNIQSPSDVTNSYAPEQKYPSKIVNRNQDLAIRQSEGQIRQGITKSEPSQGYQLSEAQLAYNQIRKIQSINQRMYPEGQDEAIQREIDGSYTQMSHKNNNQVTSSVRQGEELERQERDQVPVPDIGESRIPEDAKYQDIEQYIRKKYSSYIGKEEDYISSQSIQSRNEEARFQTFTGSVYGYQSNYSDYKVENYSQISQPSSYKYESSKPEEERYDLKQMSNYVESKYDQIKAEAYSFKKPSYLEEEQGRISDLLDVKLMERSLDKRYSSKGPQKTEDHPKQDQGEDNFQVDVKKLQQNLIPFQESRVGGTTQNNSMVKPSRFQISVVSKIGSIDDYVKIPRKSALAREENSYTYILDGAKDYGLARETRAKYTPSNPRISGEISSIDHKFEKYVLGKAKNESSKSRIGSRVQKYSSYAASDDYNQDNQQNYYNSRRPPTNKFDAGYDYLSGNQDRKTATPKASNGISYDDLRNFLKS